MHPNDSPNRSRSNTCRPSFNFFLNGVNVKDIEGNSLFITCTTSIHEALGGFIPTRSLGSLLYLSSRNDFLAVTRTDLSLDTKMLVPTLFKHPRKDTRRSFYLTCKPHESFWRAPTNNTTPSGPSAFSSQ